MNVNGKLQRQKWFPHIHHRHHRHHWPHRHHRHHWHHRHHRHHWHHRHHRHHWHHRHHRYHLHHRHRPHFHAAALWEAAKPKLIFNVKSSEFELNICGFKLDFSVEAGASLWGLTAKKDIRDQNQHQPWRYLAEDQGCRPLWVQCR